MGMGGQPMNMGQPMLMGGQPMNMGGQPMNKRLGDQLNTMERLELENEALRLENEKLKAQVEILLKMQNMKSSSPAAPPPDVYNTRGISSPNNYPPNQENFSSRGENYPPPPRDSRASFGSVPIRDVRDRDRDYSSSRSKEGRNSRDRRSYHR